MLGWILGGGVGRCRDGDGCGEGGGGGGNSATLMGVFAGGSGCCGEGRGKSSSNPCNPSESSNAGRRHCRIGVGKFLIKRGSIMLNKVVTAFCQSQSSQKFLAKLWYEHP